MKRHPPTLGTSILTMGLALTLPLVGIQAQDEPPGAPAEPAPAQPAPLAPDALQAPSAPDSTAPAAPDAVPAAPLNPTPVEEPAPATPDADPAPTQELEPVTPDLAPPPAEEPASPQPDAAPNLDQPRAQEPVPPQEPAPEQPAQPNQPDQPIQPEQPAQPDQPIQPDQPAQPVQPDQPAPIAPDTTPVPQPEQQPITPEQPQAPAVQEVTPEPGLVPMETVHSPMQEFVSHQVHEIGELSRGIEQFRAADRPDVVRMLYHMIRDHVLVKDAARSVLARRGDVSRPVTMVSMAPTPASLDEFVDHQIAHHEQMLARTEQLLAQATTPEERSVYQQSVNATRRHLNWLRSADQGQQVALGFFGPTAPLARIAGYREEARVTRANRSPNRTTRARRGSRARRR